jgi:acetate kinase
VSEPGGRRVLTINAGSSSLKAAVYRMDGDGRERRLLRLEASRIGGTGGRLQVLGVDGARLFDGDRALPDFGAALDAVLDWTDRADQPAQWDVVGHRVVHGGSRYWAPARLTPELLSALDDLVPVDPEHMPQALTCIRAIHRSRPEGPQVVCFDTGFHHTMPPVARTYPIPRSLSQAGIVRYGFHGLSYEYVSQRLCEVEGASARGRVVIAHLGNGASLAALRDGRSVDTSMGFSPMAGLMMGTRCGDIDPGLVVYLLRHERLTPDQVSDLLSARSGLLGVSETSQDMRDLLEREATDTRAACAIDLFCYQAAKYIGAYAAVLGGLDLLVFTAGIGERAAPVRERICARLGFLGLELDAGRNQAHERLISTDASRVRVRIVKTNEELMIARHASRLAT